MFRKLLKYDLRAVFKYWWIAALSSVFFAVIAGVCVNILSVDYTEYYILSVIAGIGIVLSIIGMFILPTVSLVMILVRLYKHFFSDEGYLTFTLPVKKTQLLNSKILMSFIFNFLTAVLLIIDVFLIFAIGIPEEFFDKFLWNDIFDAIGKTIDTIGVGYSAVYIIEALVLILALMLTSNLIFFVCLTVGAVIARKHKVLVAIAIYYALNSVFSGVSQFIMFEGNFFTIFNKIGELALGQQKLSAAMILLVLIGIVVAVGAGIHVFENWMLEQKLNLE